MGSRGSGKPFKINTSHGFTWKVRWTDENGVRHSRNFSQKPDATLFQRERRFEAERMRRSGAMDYLTTELTKKAGG